MFLSSRGSRLGQCSIISLHVLQELTNWAATADEAKEEELDVSAMTLLEVEQQLLGRAVRQSQRLVVLQALAVMVDSLQHTVLLRKIPQVSTEVASHRRSISKFIRN